MLGHAQVVFVVVELSVEDDDRALRWSDVKTGMDVRHALPPASSSQLDVQAGFHTSPPS